MRPRLAMAFALALLGAARPAAADEAAAPRATFHHAPPAEAPGGAPLRLLAIIDDAWHEILVVRYRPVGGGPMFAEAPFELSTTGEYIATLPADAVRRPGVEYWVVGTGKDGKSTDHFASAAWPHVVRVEPDAGLRWIEAERRRLAGRASRVRAAFTGQDFGPQGGAKDWYLRGEVDLTHRLVTHLYSFTVGFGTVDGATPSADTMAPVEEKRSARYGFGGVRLRLASSVWVDGRAIMGFDRSGFIAGGGAELTLGREWRSCVKAGFEAAGGLGPTLWFRLQWDTVPPFLMGATAIKSDLPDAHRSDGGAIAYDVSYVVGGRFTLTAAVSLAGRGRRSGGLGGSFGAAVEF